MIIILVSLVLLGEPLRKLAACVAETFQRFDILQILILDVFFGSFLLYALALVPLGLFRLYVFIILFLISVVFIAVNIVRNIAKSAKYDIFAFLRAQCFTFLVPGICVFLVFVSILTIELIPLSNIALGSVYDTSLHALFAQLISEHGCIPATHEPYLAAALIYPQGASVVFSFASILLNVVSAKAVLGVTALFIALSAFGGYFLGKEISGKPYFGAILAFTTGFIATHPRYLTWGGNNFVVAFPFLMICIGLHFGQLEKKKRTKYEIIIEGLLVGYLAAVYLPSFFVIAFLFLFEMIIRSLRNSSVSSRLAKQYILMLCSSVVVILTSVIKYALFYTFPSHNIGIPTDVQISISSYGAYPAPLWAIDQILNERFPLNASIIFLLFLGTTALVISKKSSFEKNLIGIASGAFLIPEIFLFIGSRVLEVRLITGVCLCIIPFISLNLLVAFSIYYITTAYAFHSSTDANNAKRSMRYLKKKDVFVVSALLLTILSPFVLNAFSVDEKLLSGYYSYAVASQDDYDMMLWMKENLDKTSSMILINPNDAGNFVPSVSNLKCTYPYSIYQSSASYLDVAQSLHFGKLALNEYDFMKYHNITHIFIGSSAVSWNIGNVEWNARFLIDNPNFKLIKNIGNSYLFKVLYESPEKVFQDTFNYENLTENRWTTYVPPELLEAGSGEASCYNEYANNTSLRFTAQKNHDASFYWCSIYKDVHIGEYHFPHNIKLRFLIKLASGYCQNDGLQVIISSLNWKQQAYLVTSRNLPVKQELSFTINQDGIGEFNLSEIWESLYGIPLPNDFHLQLANCDTDSIQNLAYVSDISISLESS